MAKNNINPYGTGGQLPSNIGIVNDLTTGGANVALSAEMGKDLNEMIGAPTTRVETLLDMTRASSSSAELYPTTLLAGDKLRLVYSMGGRGSLTVCTSSNGTNVDYLIKDSYAQTSGDIEITLTADADNIKVYNLNYSVDILITMTRTSPLSGLSALVYNNAESINQLDEAIGTPSTYTETVFDMTRPSSSSAQLYPATLLAGDKLRLVYSMSGRGSLTVCTSSNGTNVDYFVNDSYAQTEGDIEITLTEDADAIKVYNLNYSVEILITEEKTNSLSNITNKVIAIDSEVDSLEERVGSISGSYDDAEAILKVNNASNGNEFLGIVMLDNNYKYFSVANIKLMLDAMGNTGLNCLELGFGGSGRGLGFELNDMTFTAEDGIQYDISGELLTSSDKYLSEADMIEIISYAATKGVTIMPALNVLSHMDALLRNRQEFCYSGATTSLDFDNPTAVNFALGVSEMYAKWFAYHGCKHYNICADEFKIGNTLDNYISLHSQGIYGYATFINRWAKMLGTYRYTVHCYNDPLCVNNVKYPFINRNLVVHYWERKTGWATSEELLAEGHQLVNSNQTIYWVANGPQVSVNTMNSFNIKSFKDTTHTEVPRGAKFCIWIGTREDPALDDDGAAITTAVLPLITAFGNTVSAQISQ